MSLFIDTDPGSDDIIAIIYLMKYSTHELVGMSSVSGNLGIDTTTRNLQMLAGYFNHESHRKIPIFKGASDPIVKVSDIEASLYHGVDGCGDFFSSEYYLANKEVIDNITHSVKLSELPAALGLVEMSKRYCGELIIVALGPLTNIAIAQLIDPDFGSRIKEILIMGGDIAGHGNGDIHVGAEYNFNFDPEAAYIVLKDMNCKKTILPLEPNFSVGIEKAIANMWMEQLIKKNDPLSNIMSSILNFHSQRGDLTHLYDLMLAIIFIDPSIVTEMLAVSAVVELEGRYTRGKLVIDFDEKTKNHSFRPFREINIVKTLNRNKIFQKLHLLFA